MDLRVVDGAGDTVALDLWLWRLDVAPAHRDALAAHLEPGERTRAAAYIRDLDRERFIVARGRMREILGGYVGLAPKDVVLRPGSHGKPGLGEGPGGHGPSFNLAHAGGWAALVAGPHALPLGIDIEPWREVEQSVAERFFSASEREALGQLEGATWTAGFFNAWTRKEALLKAEGAGLSRPLDSFDVTLTPGAAARITRMTGGRGERWQLVPLELGPRFPGCIALRHSGEVRLTLREGTLPLPA